MATMNKSLNDKKYDPTFGIIPPVRDIYAEEAEYRRKIKEQQGIMSYKCCLIHILDKLDENTICLYQKIVKIDDMIISIGGEKNILIPLVKEKFISHNIINEVILMYKKEKKDIIFNTIKKKSLEYCYTHDKIKRKTLMKSFINDYMIVYDDLLNNTDRNNLLNELIELFKNKNDSNEQYLMLKWENWNFICWMSGKLLCQGCVKPTGFNNNQTQQYEEENEGICNGYYCEECLLNGNFLQP